MPIEEKLEVLQRQIRRQRLGLYAMGFGLVSVLALGMAEPIPKQMTLESLVITSKDGTARIAMGTNEKDGGVGIAMLDTKGVARIAMGTDIKGDGGLAIMDKSESPKILMGSGPDGAGIMLIGAGLTEVPAMPQEPKK
ncbi:MAG: hypothetical protein P8M22_00280 [Phycisphaerales bacterium]|nr:hypothetical protein [Phycisphaerales bacterium]